LSLERRYIAFRPVILHELIEWSGPHACFTVGAESEVDVEDSVTASFYEIDDKSGKGFEESVALRCLMDEQKLEVGCIAHLTTAELSKTENRKRA
jgi:hypothetical protein